MPEKVKEVTEWPFQIHCKISLYDDLKDVLDTNCIEYSINDNLTYSANEPQYSFDIDSVSLRHILLLVLSFGRVFIERCPENGKYIITVE